MREITTSIEIDAAPDQVWAVLADLDHYPQWNPFITEASGELRAGGRLRLRMSPAQGKGMTFKPRVLVADPGRELRWIGRLVMPGIFDGEHRFVLTALPDGRTQLEHGERFSGVLVAFVGTMIENTDADFVRLNKALKQHAEQLSTSSSER